MSNKRNFRKTTKATFDINYKSKVSRAINSK